MDSSDIISLLFAKIRPLEPENASKIIGYLLLQDLGKEDLVRLAFGPVTLLQSVCQKAKTHLGLSSDTPSTPPPLNAPPSSSPFHNVSSLPGSSSVADDVGDASRSGDFLDEQQLSDCLSFLNDSSAKNDEVADPFGSSDSNDDSHFHRRSFSASDACLGSEDSGVGYDYRFSPSGYCDNFDGRGCYGSPSKMGYINRQQEEMMKMKVAHQQRMAAAQFMSVGVSPLPHDKGLDFRLHPRNAHIQQPGQIGEEGPWYGSPGRHERGDFVGDKFNSVARQIYLTFPADSSFTDEDVSSYFSKFGPVQDVRIPFQQKRMFGFVTFVHAETVRTILARGNPHFICDSRVLVKPYKEKGKILERRQQQMERRNFSPCSSPSGIDSTDLSDCHLGPRMFSNRQEKLRREAEQADLQHAIELQRRRFVNLQLPNLENESMYRHQHSLSVGSPLLYPSHVNQNIPLRSESINEEIIKGNNDTRDRDPDSEANRAYQNDTADNRSRESGYDGEACDMNKSETRQPESEKEKCMKEK
ncbi:PREDICTED: zinc finger CCCH domain-containing protein 55-like isoform X2 [Tarenaya hassleriana]|uniref:zinc finger CCCH domain-containing protein 55-like isoform X2 n=1 Tax=Tarenaya hassleriana TaxID=28532 RepID=UPI00053C1975|nr:PREDICTED: zinc finger CCCH domain-containing protein 55-like isoform X2 [Tarenaya hassleriana]